MLKLWEQGDGGCKDEEFKLRLVYKTVFRLFYNKQMQAKVLEMLVCFI